MPDRFDKMAEDLLYCSHSQNPCIDDLCQGSLRSVVAAKLRQVDAEAKKDTTLSDLIDVAYYVTTGFGPAPNNWYVTACKENEDGHHPLTTYGPHPEKRAQEIADRMNFNLGHSAIRVAKIVASTMQKVAR